MTTDECGAALPLVALQLEIVSYTPGMYRIRDAPYIGVSTMQRRTAALYRIDHLPVLQPVRDQRNRRVDIACFFLQSGRAELGRSRAGAGGPNHRRSPVVTSSASEVGKHRQDGRLQRLSLPGPLGRDVRDDDLHEDAQRPSSCDLVSLRCLYVLHLSVRNRRPRTCVLAACEVLRTST